MELQRAFSFGTNTSEKLNGHYTEPEDCPLCKHAIKPQELHMTSYKDNNGIWYITGLYLCKHCYQTFTTLAKCHLHAATASKRTYTSQLLYCGPTRHQDRVFQKNISDISPNFVRIYNQALAAEESGLDDLCGIGYRKALEFLVKDFLIHKAPDDRASIEQMELGNCIANKVDEPSIKSVASRCAWLGNDEAHYYQRFEEYSIDTLKQLLEATVYWVSMKLTTEMAEGIERRR